VSAAAQFDLNYRLMGSLMRSRLFTIGVPLAVAAFGAADTKKAAPLAAVAPHYESPHLYVPADEVDRFVASFLATFIRSSGMSRKPHCRRSRRSPDGRVPPFATSGLGAKR
jgi:hypothetical protein